MKKSLAEKTIRKTTKKASVKKAGGKKTSIKKVVQKKKAKVGNVGKPSREDFEVFAKGVERLEELDLITKASKKFNIKPKIGVRIKLQSKASGRWVDSAGARSKFGLTTSEIFTALSKPSSVIHSLVPCAPPACSKLML